MLKHILLLTPIYVTLFWSITLNTDSRRYSNPRLFLGKFMIFTVIIYVSHFLYFESFPNLYTLIDPLYQLASLIVFPMYYIYFRLLTVDIKFRFKTHYKYLVAPVILFVLYCLGLTFTPQNEYREWIYNRNFESATFGIRYYKLIYLLIRITFLVQVVASVTGNFLLIRKHGKKAEQFYSDIFDSSTKQVKILNSSMIITGVASLVLSALGRNFFEEEITGIAIASVVFSTMLFIIGRLGDKQKSLNPTFEYNNILDTNLNSEISIGAQKNILDKILILFNEHKVYLDSKLTIQDIAQSVGTNRTYISTIINQQFNLNFCTFVNNFRVTELEKIIFEHPEYTNQSYAETCGFGSVDSMKRAVLAKTEMPLLAWKKHVLNYSKEIKKKTPILQKS